MSKEQFMQRAAELALENIRAGKGGPFGAVVVKDGKIIAEGTNLVTSIIDPTAHAEVTAIRRACEALNDFSLQGCDIYTSCEPCPMCLGAIHWARITNIYYANTRDDAALIGFDDALLYEEISKPHEQRIIPLERVNSPLAKECFSEWVHLEGRIPY